MIRYGCHISRLTLTEVGLIAFPILRAASFALLRWGRIPTDCAIIDTKPVALNGGPEADRLVGSS